MELPKQASFYEMIVGLEQEFGAVVREDQKSIFHSVNGIVDHLMAAAPVRAAAAQ